MESYKFARYWNLWNFFNIKELLDGYGFIRNREGKYLFFRKSKFNVWEILTRVEVDFVVSQVEFEDTEALTKFIEALARGVTIEKFFSVESLPVKKIRYSKKTQAKLDLYKGKYLFF